MGFQFSNSSKRRLSTVRPDLQLVVREALAMNLIDFVVSEGHRDKETQNRYFDQGKSRLKYPDGKHNKTPSEGIDLVPWIKDHISYDHRHCCVLAGIILTCAKKLGIDIRWGGNWDMDSEPITDQDFQDLVHYEIIGT